MVFIVNTVILFQYSLLNGFLLHHFFLKTKDSGPLEILLASLLLSWTLNSLALYLAARSFHLPVTQASVILLSLGISVAILLIGFAYERRFKKTTRKR
ncbi:MAG: hypothetical protein Q8P95_00220 [bacterium]|nr:hypothetical protein [bacterium]